jgi:hypothetical protein
MAVHTQALQQVSEEARDLRRTLLKLYAGQRLRKNFDWSQSSGGSDDDVSSYLNKLTEMEQRLYYTGSSAVSALEDWKLVGNRRLLMGPSSSMNNDNDGTARTPMQSWSNKRSVTPATAGDDERREPAGQRRRLQ